MSRALFAEYLRDIVVSRLNDLLGENLKTVFDLPAYSPEFNPDEGLHADLKQAVTRKAPVRSKQQLKRATVSHMRRLSKLPARVRSYFRHKPVRYAA